MHIHWPGVDTNRCYLSYLVRHPTCTRRSKIPSLARYLATGVDGTGRRLRLLPSNLLQRRPGRDESRPSSDRDLVCYLWNQWKFLLQFVHDQERDHERGRHVEGTHQHRWRWDMFFLESALLKLFIKKFAIVSKWESNLWPHYCYRRLNPLDQREKQGIPIWIYILCK